MAGFTGQLPALPRAAVRSATDAAGGHPVAGPARALISAA